MNPQNHRYDQTQIPFDFNRVTTTSRTIVRIFFNITFSQSTMLCRTFNPSNTLPETNAHPVKLLSPHNPSKHPKSLSTSLTCMHGLMNPRSHQYDQSQVPFDFNRVPLAIPQQSSTIPAPRNLSIIPVTSPIPTTSQANTLHCQKDEGGALEKSKTSTWAEIAEKSAEYGSPASGSSNARVSPSDHSPVFEGHKVFGTWANLREKGLTEIAYKQGLRGGPTLRDNMEELKVVADYFEVAKGSKLLR